MAPRASCPAVSLKFFHRPWEIGVAHWQNDGNCQLRLMSRPQTAWEIFFLIRKKWTNRFWPMQLQTQNCTCASAPVSPDKMAAKLAVGATNQPMATINLPPTPSQAYPSPGKIL
jgi:hypothetical protein